MYKSTPKHKESHNIITLIQIVNVNSKENKVNCISLKVALNANTT